MNVEYSLIVVVGNKKSTVRYVVFKSLYVFFKIKVYTLCNSIRVVLLFFITRIVIIVYVFASAVL